MRAPAGRVTSCLRLPHGVKELFDAWLVEHYPTATRKNPAPGSARCAADVSTTRVSARAWPVRDLYAEQVHALFQATRACAAGSTRPRAGASSRHRRSGLPAAANTSVSLRLELATPPAHGCGGEGLLWLWCAVCCAGWRSALAIAITISIVTPLVLLAIGIQVEITPVRAAHRRARQRGAGPRATPRRPGVRGAELLWPTLEVHDVSISDPYGSEGAEFARLARARGGALPLLPILRGKARPLDELSADGVRLNLVRYADGNASWAFDLPSAPKRKPPKPAPRAAEDEAKDTRIFGELEELAFRD